jgi:cytochrome c
MTKGMAFSPAGTLAHAVCALAATLLPLAAAANPELARDKRCLNCHTIDRKIVGPAFKDVATRYAKQPDAVPRLADKIVKGGAGAWGPVPMAANPHVSADEARRLDNWVLSIR